MSATEPGAMRIYDAPTEELLASQHRDPLLRHLSRIVVDRALKYSPPERGAAIDVGCGVGRTSLALAAAGYEVTGVDPSARAVELAQRAAARAGTAHFEVGDATTAAPAQHVGRFALAVCSEVLEHVLEPAAVVAYCGAVLRPGGYLIATTPHDRRQWTAMDTYAGHVTRFSVGELRALLGAGWRVHELSTEGFPFQRAAMKSYDALLRRRGGEHEFATFGASPLYGAYVHTMPLLLRVDHLLRGLRRGTTLVAVAERLPSATVTPPHTPT